jgi:FKBP-type peptidyl-prolyl cis-trans isomerase FkpA
MFNKFEIIGIGVSILSMATALFLINIETNSFSMTQTNDTNNEKTGAVYVPNEENQQAALRNAIIDSAGANGKLEKLIIDDVRIGTGDEVVNGDTVTVHYVGTLQNGQEFDNSNKRGQPFTFTVGAGQVIKGWEEGVLGMKTGGTRILVIPSDMAYGDRGIGPIPGGASLVFSIELLAIE